MRARHLLSPPAAIAALALFAGPASSASQTVTATSNDTFVAKYVTVSPGETVTFQNGGGEHNVAFDLGPRLNAPDLSSWVVSRTFAAPGAYAYYCQIHGAPGVSGMAGVVYVAGPRPSVTGASVLGQVHKLRLRFSSSQAGLLDGTVSKRLASGRYAASGRLSGSVRAGLTTKYLSRAAGTYRVTFRVRGAQPSAFLTRIATVG
jgi:plastocyanin